MKTCTECGTNIDKPFTTIKGVFCSEKCSKKNIFKIKDVNLKVYSYLTILDLYEAYKNNSLIFDKSKVKGLENNSEFIEFGLMSLPLVIITDFDEEENKTIIKNGNKILFSIFNFIDNKFELSGLKILTQYEGKKFKDLQPINKGILTRKIPLEIRIEKVFMNNDILYNHIISQY